MDEIEIVHLNVKRFRRMLQTELDWPKRQIIENMLREFEDRLAVSEGNGRCAAIASGNSAGSSNRFSN